MGEGAQKETDGEKHLRGVEPKDPFSDPESGEKDVGEDGAELGGELTRDDCNGRR